ncbi:glycosyltransferase family 4 protein [Corynebacterium oculi]|uniref:GDP-mannose-dependent alpha-(1-6)-phosphatidylinositol monomannoside mannosyltransferase n=1 Tax=Corynebacterium oculi TaxID=1544416 RepID=A0A0Q0Z6K8_9CORY|nr:glycosyltransferase family 4 protein [Corynebacterium oculi]KQB85198.1 GDP-mannose-dependent alpha-(1-6)-phosphatidylinositol monomannoside mannosyltransferase [Corynebacterium oculi]
MPTMLLVTNDFPPRVGGIQSYLRDFVSRLDPHDIVVFASTQDAEAAREHDAQVPYTVVRWPHSVMLPTPATVRRMRELIREHRITTVWFGAAAPLAVMGGAAKRAGARRVIATTHGHEVGWSMLPGARQVLRAIGRKADVVTYISEYTLRRFRRAFGPGPRFEHLPSGVDVEVFAPLGAHAKASVRARWGIAEGTPLVVCVSRLVPRKGQDQLLRAMPRVREAVGEVQLVIVGQGRYEGVLRALARRYDPTAILAGSLPFAQMVELLGSADVAAVPARTRGKGLDVEGLGIVYLEAQACGVPVITGDSGGAPETVRPDTGYVVRGNDVDELAEALIDALGSPQRRAAMGAAGRRYVEQNWTWEIMSARLRRLLNVSEPRLY